MAWSDLTDEEKKKRLYVLNNNLLLQYRHNSNPADSGSGGEASPTVVEVPFGVVDDYIFYIPTHKTQYMYQEFASGSTNPVTQVAANGDPVSYMNIEGSPLNIKTANTRPVFDNSTGKCALKFTRASSNILVFPNTKKFFRNLHSHVVTLFFWVKLSSNTDAIFFDSAGATLGTRTGWIIYRLNSDGKLYLSEYTAGVAINNVSSSNSFNAASDWTPCFIELNGNGTNKGRIRVGSTTTTFNVTSATVADQFLDACIGGFASVSGAFYFDGYIAHMGMINRAITEPEWTSFLAFNPTINTTSLPTAQECVHIDYTDVSTNWADLARTTPITNGTALLYSDNKITSKFGSFNKDVIGAAGTTNPLWITNLLNGYAAARWDGSNDVLGFNARDHEWWPEGGTYSCYWVCKNRTASFGSDFMQSGGSMYIVNTGDAYGSGIEGFTIHTLASTTDGTTTTATLKNTHQAFNVIAYRRHGRYWTLFDGYGNKYEAENPDRQLLTQWGVTINAGFESSIECTEFKFVIGYETDAQIIAKIIAFNTKYNI